MVSLRRVIKSILWKVDKENTLIEWMSINRENNVNMDPKSKIMMKKANVLSKKDNKDYKITFNEDIVDAYEITSKNGCIDNNGSTMREIIQSRCEKNVGIP